MMSGIIRHHSITFGFPWEAERDRGWVSPLRNLAAPAGCCDGQIDALIAPSCRQMMSLIIRHHSTTQGVGQSLLSSHDGVMRSRNDLCRVSPLPGFDRSANLNQLPATPVPLGQTSGEAVPSRDTLGVVPTSVVVALWRFCGAVDK